MLQNEKIIETKICRHCGSSFDITDKDLEFYEKVSPVFPNSGVSFSTLGLKQAFPPREKGVEENLPLNGGGTKEGDQSPNSEKFGLKKYLTPPPTLCPECRKQRRLSFRNERKLYKRKCDFSGRDIISIYSPDKPYKVYDQEIWWSDKWDSMDYGCDFGFSKSFFEQFEELMKEVPFQNLIGSNNENCPFCNLIADNKNCYLLFESSNNEDCYYSYWLQKSNNCLDCSFIHEGENCYQCDNCFNCYNSFFLSSCKNCYNCVLSEDCHGCKNCYGCVNLNNKEYYFFNKKLTKEKYKEEIRKMVINDNSISKFNIFKTQFPKKYSRILKSENCSGGQIENSKNCIYSFHAYDSEDCKYAEHIWRNAKNCMDVSTAGRDANLIFETINCGIGVHKNIFCAIVWGSQNMSYCFSCFNSHDCFGCIGLKNKSYCILNKQYSKEEYEILVPKIITHMIKTGEWGEFFPSSFSPFGYNETVAQEYYPINPPILTLFPPREKGGSNLFSFSLGGKDAGKADRGTFNWSTYEAPFPNVEKIIPASKLPNNINDIPDDILNWAIECEITKKPFRIIKQELEFYRKHNLPIPRRHPDQRHLDRMSLRNPRKLFTRICDKCGKEIQTTYAPERPEIVYCEECYNREIY